MDILVSGLAMGESPRWHGSQLWFSDWGAQEILATDLAGTHTSPLFHRHAEIVRRVQGPLG